MVRVHGHPEGLQSKNIEKSVSLSLIFEGNKDKVRKSPILILKTHLPFAFVNFHSSCGVNLAFQDLSTSYLSKNITNLV